MLAVLCLGFGVVGPSCSNFYCTCSANYKSGGNRPQVDFEGAFGAESPLGLGSCLRDLCAVWMPITLL